MLVENQYAKSGHPSVVFHFYSSMLDNTKKRKKKSFVRWYVPLSCTVHLKSKKKKKKKKLKIKESVCHFLSRANILNSDKP